MKKNILTLLTCFAFAFSVYAETFAYDANEDVKKSIPLTVGGRGADAVLKDKKNEIVCLVGKVIVKYNGDLDRIRKYRGLGENFVGKESIYKPIGHADKAVYSDGELFCGLVRLPESGDMVITSNKNSVTNGGNYVHISYNYMRYYFNGSAKMELTLPISYNIKVPEGEKFLYIGTLVYEFEGDFFTLKKITVVDEYDEAQEELNKFIESQRSLRKNFTRKDYTLCRVDLNP